MIIHNSVNGTYTTIQNQISIDFFDIKKYIIPYTPLKLKMKLVNKNVLLYKNASATNDYKFLLQNVAFHVRRVHVTPSVYSAIERNLNMEKAIYCYSRPITKYHFLDKSKTSVSWTDIFQNHIPKAISFGILKSENLSSDMTKDSIAFTSNILKTLKMYVNNTMVQNEEFSFEHYNYYYSPYNNFKGGIDGYLFYYKL